MRHRLRGILVCVLHARILPHLHEHQQLRLRAMPAVLGRLVARSGGRRRRNVHGHAVTALLLSSPDVCQKGQKGETLKEEGGESAMDEQDHRHHHHDGATTACQCIVGNAKIFFGTLITSFVCRGRKSTCQRPCTHITHPLTYSLSLSLSFM